MKFTDVIRWIAAKVLCRQTVLFSKKNDWESHIKEVVARQLRALVPFFYEFDEVRPGNFDLIVPITIAAQKYLNDNLNHLNGSKTLIPSNTSIDICDDKERFAIFLMDSGFSDFVPKINAKFSYPYILKKKIGQWGEDITVITDTQCELSNIDDLKSRDFFTQEYIDGFDEYTTHIIFNHDIVFYKTIKFTYSDRLFIKGKNSQHTAQEVVDHGCFKELFESILSKLGYRGICCFNYKLDKGIVKIFEVNPRYGGSMTYFLNEALVSYRETLSIP